MVRLDGTLAYTFFQGALNGKIFLDYIRNILVPTLHEGDIVIMDNMSTHHSKAVREVIDKLKINVIFLPPYIPDFFIFAIMLSAPC